MAGSFFFLETAAARLTRSILAAEFVGRFQMERQSAASDRFDD